MVNRIIIQLIRGYQNWFSPFLMHSCRFHPSCSEYSAQALDRYGFLKALKLTFLRLAKCHPWHPGGADPIK